MNASKKQKILKTCLVIAISLFLGNPLTAHGFASNSPKAGNGGADKAGSIPMQSVTGTVVQTMDSGGYTYALVQKDGAGTWVALPKSRLAVGNEITCKPGMVMNNFSSSSLGRTFKEIVFSGGVTSISSGTAPPIEDMAQAEEEEKPVPKPKVKETEEWKDFFK